jgi:O-antigen ligase
VGVGYIFFWLWVKRRRVVGKFWLRLWLVVGLALAVLFIFNFKYTRDGFYTISYKFLPYRQLEVENGRVYATQFSQEDRRWLREVAWKMFEENPVLGVGPGNFGLLHNQYVREEKMKRPYLAKAHNAYLEILAEAGLLGLIAFLAFLVSLFGLSLKNLSQIKKDEQFYLILALQASLIAIIIQGFGFGILAHSYTWILFGFLYGEVRTER